MCISSACALTCLESLSIRSSSQKRERSQTQMRSARQWSRALCASPRARTLNARNLLLRLVERVPVRVRGHSRPPLRHQVPHHLDAPWHGFLRRRRGIVPRAQGHAARLRDERSPLVGQVADPALGGGHGGGADVPVRVEREGEEVRGQLRPPPLRPAGTRQSEYSGAMSELLEVSQARGKVVQNMTNETQRTSSGSASGTQRKSAASAAQVVGSAGGSRGLPPPPEP